MRRLQRGITKSTRIALALATPILLLLVLFGQWFLLLFGEGFASGYNALVILCIGQFVSVAVGPAGWILLMTGNEQKAVVALAVSTTLNITLNFMLIPRMGINGAAIATASSAFVMNLILVGFVWKSLGLNPTALVLKSRER